MQNQSIKIALSSSTWDTKVHLIGIPKNGYFLIQDERPIFKAKLHPLNGIGTLT